MYHTNPHELQSSFCIGSLHRSGFIFILQLILSFTLSFGCCSLVCGLDVVEFASAASPSATPTVPPAACASSMQQCGTLGPLMYPFGKEGSHCGASPKFLLSNCSNGSSLAYWDAFYGSPAVRGLNVSGTVNLTWMNSSAFIPTSTSSQSCNVYDRQQLPLLLPNSTMSSSGIDLRNSADFSAFSLSPNNIFLLFNCTDLAHANSSNYIETNSKNCKSFQQQCTNLEFNKTLEGSCVQFQPQFQLNLPKAMNLSACSHFQFLVTQDASLPVNDWKPHVVQLSWAPNDYNFHLGSSCRVCQESRGTCGYEDNGDGSEAFRCFCSDNQYSAIDCKHLTGGSGSRFASARIWGVLAGLVAVILLAAIVTFSWLRRRRRRIFTSRSVPNSNNSKLWSQRARLLSSRLGPICSQEYSYQEVCDATHSFADNNIIGDGGFGAVYRGTLKDGHLVAIKRLFHDSFSRMDHFYNEIQILSRLDHPNLVKLYGFCCEDERDLLLVFEYLSNGSVFDQLHWEDVEGKGALSPPGAGIPSWRVRLTIAMETAEALSYMHNCISPPILHRDVKTSNILLDEGFHAKLADFGLSRLVPLEVTHVSTSPQGTPGYVDPEYQSCYRLTAKSDVYSFGVVLMELVSSKRAVDMSRNEKEINLSSLALSRQKQGTWKELVDIQCWQMEEDPNVEVVVGEVVQLAFWCLQPEKVDRPCMRDVAATLTKLWQSYASQPSLHDEADPGQFFAQYEGEKEHNSSSR